MPFLQTFLVGSSRNLRDGKSRVHITNIKREEGFMAADRLKSGPLCKPTTRSTSRQMNRVQPAERFPRLLPLGEWVFQQGGNAGQFLQVACMLHKGGLRLQTRRALDVGWFLGVGTDSALATHNCVAASPRAGLTQKEGYRGRVSEQVLFDPAVGSNDLLDSRLTSCDSVAPATFM